MLDEENTKEVHQQRAQANAQETQQGDRMGAETPVQVSLARLEGFLFHDARTGSYTTPKAEKGPAGWEQSRSHFLGESTRGT